MTLVKERDQPVAQSDKRWVRTREWLTQTATDTTASALGDAAAGFLG
jgi:hypothetical protein